VIRQESSPSLEVGNAYFLSMSLQNIRCFGDTQVLDLQSAPGTPARWTLILGENGVGKTTLMLLLVLGSPERERDRLTEERARRTATPKAAPDAKVVVLRRRDDGVVIDNAPPSVRKWRIDQILTSELFDLPSARAPELDASIAERDAILAKPELTDQDQQRLTELREQLGALPHGDTPEGIEAMDIIRRAAKALCAMQHGKCAFCEATPLAVSDGDVEHFRPKGSVQQTDDDPLERPGYYWLAYDWMNLMLSCGRCNQRHKKNLFPLFDPARRAKTPQDTIASEDPVLIDPSAEDPEQHISYREHVPIAVRGSVRGEQTIEALGLRRPDLNADREKHLAQVRILHATASIPGVPDELRTQALASLADVTSPASKYSLMCRAVLGAQLLAPVEPASTAPQRI
jgi:uncharacterized protein (TIGR02646 family)